MLSFVEPHQETPVQQSYLDGFRVEACPLFKQHQCQQHRPYTCFNWHFANQRRRKPTRRPDGSFNYSPDIYCDKYDENTGICADGDGCPYLHRVSGDVERKYHLRYYKTAQCVHPTDARGQCVKNGAHCAFAHSQQDLRQPQHDTSETAYAGCLGDTDGRDRTSFVIDDPLWHRGFLDCRQEHVLSCYKTEQCRKPARLCRQGYACPFYHNSKDRRRQPAVFKYRSTPCPAAKTADEWLDPELCEQGDNCGYCHTRTEQQFHPEIYKSTKCNDMLEHGYCPRAVFCAFAHHDSEMHVQRTPYAYTSQNSPKEHGSPDYRLGSPAALNGSTNGLNLNGGYQNMVKSRAQAIPNGRPFSSSRDDLMSSSYPKAPGFERGPLSPNCQADQRIRTYSLNIGTLDMARRAAMLSGQWGATQGDTGGLANASNLCRSDSGFHAVSSTMEELSLDLAPIDEHRDTNKFSDIFSTSLPSPMNIGGPGRGGLQMDGAGPQPFVASPFGQDGTQALFQQPQKMMHSPGSLPPFQGFPGQPKHPHDNPIQDYGMTNGQGRVEEKLAEAQIAAQTWKSNCDYYKMMAEKAAFERDQLLQQIERMQIQGGPVGQNVDFSSPPPPTSSYNLFGNPTDDVWKPLPVPDSPPQNQ